MSKSIPWWNSTVTVYNRYEDPLTQVVTWYRTSLQKCFWKTNTTAVAISNVSQTYTNVVICRIPKSSKYANPYTWKTLDAQTKQTRFTLKPGDIVINGNVTDDIDEYTKGHRSTDLVEKYKDLGVIVIDVVADNSDTVRNLPHYVVS